MTVADEVTDTPDPKAVHNMSDGSTSSEAPFIRRRRTDTGKAPSSMTVANAQGNHGESARSMSSNNAVPHNHPVDDSLTRLQEDDGKTVKQTPSGQKSVRLWQTDIKAFFKPKEAENKNPVSSFSQTIVKRSDQATAAHGGVPYSGTATPLQPEQEHEPTSGRGVGRGGGDGRAAKPMPPPSRQVDKGLNELSADVVDQAMVPRRKLECSECRKPYKRLHDLIKHELKKHGVGSEDENPNADVPTRPKLICDECGRGFVWKQHLLSHKDKKHRMDDEISDSSDVSQTCDEAPADEAPVNDVDEDERRLVTCTHADKEGSMHQRNESIEDDELSRNVSKSKHSQKRDRDDDDTTDGNSIKRSRLN